MFLKVEMGLEAYRRNGIPIDDFITIPQEGCQYENPDQPSCSIQYNSYVFQWWSISVNMP